MLECFERAAYPHVSDDRKKELLHFVMVGGGPINIELCGELYDFINQDVKRYYPELLPHVKLTICDPAPHVLGPFNPELQTYVEKKLLARKINVMTRKGVKEVKDGEVVLSTDEVLKCSMVVWATGVKPVNFTQMKHDENPEDFVFWNGRLVMDDYMRILRPGKERSRDGIMVPH